VMGGSIGSLPAQTIRKVVERVKVLLEAETSSPA
jgi:hypothetical protein